jgi:hypothetical protein
MEQDMFPSVNQAGVVDVVAIDKMVMCGKIGAFSSHLLLGTPCLQPKGLNTSSP